MYKILLIGDNCIDEYQYGTVDRISPEAPVPVFKLGNKIVSDGMGGNVKNNLENLGCKVIPFLGNKSIKTRFIDIRSNQHIVRLDNDVQSEPLTIDQIKNDPIFSDEITGISVDAIVISDYNKGFVTYELIEDIVRCYRDVPIFLDTKKDDLARFEGCFVKINKDEREKVKTVCSELIVTLGHNGASYKDTIFPAQKIDVVDVCGAGDTFLASLAFKYLKTKSIEKSIPFAIVASSVTVQHMGVYAPNRKDLEGTYT